MPGPDLTEICLLLQALQSIAPLSVALQDRLGVALLREERRRRELLLEQGRTAERLYFMISGFARSYVMDSDGREHTTSFMGPRDFIISASSFFSQEPAAEWIELLEESVLLSLSWRQLSHIYEEFPEFNHQMRRITEHYYQESERRTILFRSLKPAERYHHLLSHYPELLQQTSLGQVASFLGVTQATLSRIRARRF